MGREGNDLETLSGGSWDAGKLLFLDKGAGYLRFYFYYYYYYFKKPLELHHYGLHGFFMFACTNSSFFKRNFRYIWIKKVSLSKIYSEIVDKEYTVGKKIWIHKVFYFLTTSSISSLFISPSDNHNPNLFFYEFVCFLFLGSIYKWDNTAFIFLCLIFHLA